MGLLHHHRPRRALYSYTVVPEWVAQAHSSPSTSCGTTTMTPRSRLKTYILSLTNYCNFDTLSSFWPNITIKIKYHNFDQIFLTKTLQGQDPRPAPHRGGASIPALPDGSEERPVRLHCKVPQLRGEHRGRWLLWGGQGRKRRPELRRRLSLIIEKYILIITRPIESHTA